MRHYTIELIDKSHQFSKTLATANHYTEAIDIAKKNVIEEGYIGMGILCHKINELNKRVYSVFVIWYK
jgi:hypothetical protein